MDESKKALPTHDFKVEDVMVRVYHVDKGFGLPKHEHSYKHATVCYAGRLLVTKENLRLEMTKETRPVILKEEEWHELEALEDGTIFSNIFAEDKY
jgi:quercetin dioxygenase-like cupin family protein